MHSFRDDYSETAHPRILQALQSGNLEQDEGYGCDRRCAAARQHIKARLGAYGIEPTFIFYAAAPRAI